MVVHFVKWEAAYGRTAW